MANIKTFNLLTNYNTELMEGQQYNMTLLGILKDVINTYNKTGEMIPIKADFLAERSIPDNIAEEGT